VPTIGLNETQLGIAGEYYLFFFREDVVMHLIMID
jgi:hypothetical protein